jgi:hypothetical protein
MILFKVLTKKFVKDKRFTISEFSREVLHISRTVLYEHITVRLSHVLRKMGSENGHKTQRMASALTFLELITRPRSPTVCEIIVKSKNQGPGPKVAVEPVKKKSQRWR